MYQTVGTSAAQYIADAMDLPLYVGTISGSGNSTGRDYLPTQVYNELIMYKKNISSADYLNAIEVFNP